MDAAIRAQQALVEKHREYADALALDILRGLPKFVRAEDVKAVARVGLVDAASRFDATRGVQFTTFAYYRIRGAVFNWVREQCENDPLHLARAASQRAADALAQDVAERDKSAAAPTIDAQTEAMTTLEGLLDGAVASFMLGEAAAYYDPSFQQRSTPEAEVAEVQASAFVRTVVDSLPDKERTMLVQVYFDGRTIEQAGQSLGLSKSWASRLHARALKLMREKLPLEYAT
jgi:RNA polymerase sigma factor for flagellar operon FliA